MNDNVTFLGEVCGEALGISNATLIETFNLPTTNIQNQQEPWLRFTIDGKTVLVAKKPLLHSVSWDTLEECGVVFGNNVIEVGDFKYKIRLLSGVSKTPGINEIGFDSQSTHGSEWNRLMYRVHSGVHTDPKNVMDSNPHAALADYSDSDLIMYPTFGLGSKTWCMESAGSEDYKVIRGYSGVSALSRDLSSTPHVNGGWRPVLELVGVR